MDRIDHTVGVTENYNGWKGEELVKSTGASYVPGRDVKDIAKDVRSLIKKAVKAGYLPNLKASVKISRFAGGCSLDVTVTGIDVCVINVDAWRNQADNGFNLSWADCGGMYNARGREVLDTLERFQKAFQKVESHGQSDYHNTNFYDHTGFCSVLKNEQVAEFVEKIDG